MKALSLKEPWASLVRSGKKTIETRKWKTNHRGRLLICASAKPVSEFSGKAIAIATVRDCRPMSKVDEKDACCELYPKAQAWILENITPIKPFPVKGQLGIFEVDFDE
jgi:activating signal cointegrator 1